MWNSIPAVLGQCLPSCCLLSRQPLHGVAQQCQLLPARARVGIAVAQAEGDPVCDVPPLPSLSAGDDGRPVLIRDNGYRTFADLQRNVVRAAAIAAEDMPYWRSLR
ncbi:MAG TPA: hypothetical protein DGT21_24135 [Armatimonadetes bacterium]|jgi:hypothetical protein|nr:hypothetical protein [Armatimonadota bacterium]